jgi:hypothetical protein
VLPKTIEPNLGLQDILKKIQESVGGTLGPDPSTRGEIDPERSFEP